MPVWPGYRAASAGARDEWDRWWTALEAHECGHISVVTAAFGDLDRQLVGATVADADAAFRAAVARAQADSDAYDAATAHGLNSGTVMDTGSRSDAAMA